MPDSSVVFNPLDTARDILATNCLFIMAETFLFYDQLVTWAEEINHLWLRPKTKSAYWFFFNRYFALFGNIASLILEFTHLSSERSGFINELDIPQLYHSLAAVSDSTCFVRFFLFVNKFSLAVILLTLRTYALYRCSSRILVFMLGSAAILVGISCYSLFGQKNAQSDGGNCRIGLSQVTAIRIASAWEALFIYDSLIFGLTMAQSWKTRHEHGLPITESPIVYVIFRDGAAYFGIMALANLANILTFYLCGPIMRGSLSVFASSVSVTMMSRLMLNLHRMTIVGIYSTGGTDVMITDVDIDFRRNDRTDEVELDTRQGQVGTGNAAHAQTSAASAQ